MIILFLAMIVCCMVACVGFIFILHYDMKGLKASLAVAVIVVTCIAILSVTTSVLLDKPSL